MMQIVTRQNLNLKSSFKSRCIGDEKSRYLILEHEKGYTTDIDGDNVNEYRTLDILYYDKSMEFYQYADIPLGHYDIVDNKIYVDGTDFSELYSYKTLLHMAENIVSEFYEMNTDTTSESTSTATEEHTDQTTPRGSGVLDHKEEALEEAKGYIEYGTIRTDKDLLTS